MVCSYIEVASLKQSKCQEMHSIQETDFKQTVDLYSYFLTCTYHSLGRYDLALVHPILLGTNL